MVVIQFGAIAAVALLYWRQVVSMLRGALGLPDSPYRTHLVTVTYAIVLFTIAVQGLTIMPLVRRAVDATPEEG